jgi:hypothetical protein
MYHSPQSNIWNTIVKLFLEHPALSWKATLNRNNASSNSVYYATLRQFKVLYKSSE